MRIFPFFFFLMSVQFRLFLCEILDTSVGLEIKLVCLQVRTVFKNLASSKYEIRLYSRRE